MNCSLQRFQVHENGRHRRVLRYDWRSVNDEADRLLGRLCDERIAVFHVRSAVEFGTIDG